MRRVTDPKSQGSQAPFLPVGLSLYIWVPSKPWQIAELGRPPVQFHILYYFIGIVKRRTHEIPGLPGETGIQVEIFSLGSGSETERVGDCN